MAVVVVVMMEVVEVMDLVLVVVLDHYNIVHSWDLSHGLEVVWIMKVVCRCWNRLVGVVKP